MGKENQVKRLWRSFYFEEVYDIGEAFVCLVFSSKVTFLTRKLMKLGGYLSHVGPGNHILDGSRDPSREGEILGVIWPNEKQWESLLRCTRQKR